MVSPQNGVFGGTFFYKIALMMTTILVPLRMLELGFSAAEIGVVAAMPAVFQLVVRPMGGVFCDWSADVGCWWSAIRP